MFSLSTSQGFREIVGQNFQVLSLILNVVLSYLPYATRGPIKITVYSKKKDTDMRKLIRTKLLAKKV